MKNTSNSINRTLTNTHAKITQFKGKCRNFILEEKSAREVANEGYMIYAGLILGIIAVFIASSFMDKGYNSIGSFFTDGVEGNVNQTGLNQWSGQTNGFNKK